MQVLEMQDLYLASNYQQVEYQTQIHAHKFFAQIVLRKISLKGHHQVLHAAQAGSFQVLTNCGVHGTYLKI